MALELVKALLTIVKVCIDNSDCNDCLIKEFCGKIPSEW